MENKVHSNSYTSFDGHRLIASGPLQTVALVVKHALESGAIGPVLLFDDSTGRSIDIDTRGTVDDVTARFAIPADLSVSCETEQPGPCNLPAADPASMEATADIPRGRGRPKLGVVAREVTLLPRHWNWLAAQSGGASVILRKLVEEARRTHGDKDTIRKKQERAYYFMSAMAGDMQDFEEATRALFANDQTKFGILMATWPADIREHICRLAYSDEIHL